MISDNNLIFDASSGPIMEGHWVNPKTGDTFTVRDSFFQDNQYIVQTTDGRMLDYNFIQNYVKVEKESDLQNFKKSFESNNNQKIDIPDEIKNMVETNNNGSSAIDYSEYMTEEDKNIGLGLGNINDRSNKLESNNVDIEYAINKHSNISTTQIDNEDLLFIKRVLKNIETPNLKISIDWETIPVNKLDTLINMLGVDIDNIADWIMKDMDLVRIKNDIKQSICDKIQLCVDGKPNAGTPDKKPEEHTPIKKSSPVTKKTRRSVDEK